MPRTIIDYFQFGSSFAGLSLSAVFFDEQAALLNSIEHAMTVLGEPEEGSYLLRFLCRKIILALSTSNHRTL
jgi:hypothetical protein